MICALAFSSLCFANNPLYHFGNCLFPAMYSSPHIFFIVWFYTSDTLDSMITSSVLLSCTIICVDPTDFIVVCVMIAWLANTSSWYTGIPDVFIYSGGICWWFVVICWVPVGVGHFYPAITMCCVGKIWMNGECAHRLDSEGSITKNCAWGNKCLALLSLHCQIMQELIKVSSWGCMSDVYVLSIILSYTMAESKSFSNT